MKMLKNKYIIKNAYPAVKWNDATPIGNGTIGGLIYGGIGDDKILINHEKCYYGKKTPELPDVSYLLKKVRDLLDKGEYLQAERQYSEELQKLNYNASVGIYSPLFDLNISMEIEKPFKNYSRSLDMSSAEAKTEWTDGSSKNKKQFFISCTDNLLIGKISAKFGTAIYLSPHDLTDDLNMSGDKCGTAICFESFFKSGMLISKIKINDSDEFCAIIRIITDGKINIFDNISPVFFENIGQADIKIKHPYFYIENSKEITLFCTVFENNAENFEREFDRLKNLDSSYEMLFKRHYKIHNEKMCRTEIVLNEKDYTRTVDELLQKSYSENVPPVLIEKMSDFGRYLLICSSNSGFPANLQGIWNGNYCPAWFGAYFLNENVQMNYCQAFAGQLSCTIMPLFDMLDNLKEDFKTNAKKLYGCKGLLLPVYLDCSCGIKKDLQPHVLYWTAGGAWICKFFFDYYLYTRDKDFLLNKAYPFMKECAEFYEDFLQKDIEGSLKSYPGISPENCASGDFPGNGKIFVSINPAMDIACNRELLTNLINCCEILKIADSKINIWKDMLKNLPDYTINKDGAFSEWLHKDFKDNYLHRHLSHIYPLFPGNEIDFYKSKKYIEAIKTAMEKRSNIGLKAQTGWSFAHMANIFARLHDGKQVYEALENIIKYCTGKNLFTYHNDWRNMGATVKLKWGNEAPFQIDANMGFTAAIYECFIYSDENTIGLLPAMPENINKAFAKGIMTKTGVITDISFDRNKKTLEVIFYSDNDVTFNLYLPNGTKQKIKLIKGSKLFNFLF